MKKLPNWLRQEIPDMDLIRTRLDDFKGLKINTVCLHAHCPNIFDCFKHNAVTFMILGDACTRNCAFCAVKNSTPKNINLDEPRNIALAVERLGLRYVVVTSVTRDDLYDGGAGHFFNTVRAIKGLIPECKVEILIPDFRGDINALSKVVRSGADVISHNMETIFNLYPSIRPQADYKRSLGVLGNIKKTDNSIITKSGIMLGLGETFEEVAGLMNDLREVDCDIMTIGQYLAPSISHAQVKRFIPPEEFADLRNAAISLGFKSVSSAPLVRSSFHSQELLEECLMS